MSSTIDEKVVKLEFDNSNFERNVQKTLGTLDSLNQAINFKNAEKSFSQLENVASNINIDETLLDSNSKIVASFDAMTVFAVTALSKIASAAIDTGVSLAKSMSLDQISAGWSKYEEKTGAIQTLVNSTGKTVDEINEYLSRLMWFSDETSYSFTEMVSALGSMTTTGSSIDDVIPMLMGIANATAYAGKGATEFSRVIYNLTQSYNQGFLSLSDWRSVSLQGVGSKALMQALIDAGKELGTITNANQVTLSNFETTLKKKWATPEVMQKAFSQFSKLTLAVEEAIKNGEFELAADAIDALADNFDELSVRAFRSSQEAKTFKEAIVATKDAVSSGFMSTFELIFGNYEEAKVLWTDLADGLWEIFASGSKARNEIMAEATDNYWAWESLTKIINDSGLSVDDFKEKLVNVLSNTGYDIDDLVRRYGTLEKAISHIGVPLDILMLVWNKFFGKKNKEILDEITERGEDATDQYARTTEKIERLFSVISKESGRFKVSDTINNFLIAIQTFATIVKGSISDIFGEVDADVIYNILDNINKFSKWLIISGAESDEFTGTAKDLALAFGGIFSIIKLIFEIIKTAGKTASKILNSIFGDENGNLLSFIGHLGELVSIAVDLIEKSGVISTIFNTISSIFIPIVSAVWDFINAFKSSPAVIEFINNFMADLSTLFSSINGWISGISEAENPIAYIMSGLISGAGDIVKFGIELIEALWEGLQQTIREKAGLAEDESVGKYLIDGLIQGIRDAIPVLLEVIVEIGKSILDTIKDILGIHSPSTEAKEVGKSLIEGLWEGFKEGTSTILSELADFIVSIFTGVIDALSSIPSEKIEGFATMAGLLPTIFKAVSGLVAPLLGLGDLMLSTGVLLRNLGWGWWNITKGFKIFLKRIGTGFKRLMTGLAFKAIAAGIKDIAIGFALIAGSLFLLTFADTDALYERIVMMILVLSALFIFVKGLMTVAGGMKGAGPRLLAMGVTFVLLGFALIELSAALVILGKMSWDELIKGIVGVGALFVFLSGFVIGLSSIDPTGAKLLAIAGMIGIISMSMALLSAVLVVIGSLGWEKLAIGIIGIGMLMLFISLFVKDLTMLDPTGKQLFTVSLIIIILSIALNLLAKVLTTIASLGWEGLGIGIIGLGLLMIFVEKFILSLTTISPDGKKILLVAVITMLMAVALKALAKVLVLIGSLSWDQLAVGIVGIGALLIFIVGFIKGVTSIDPTGTRIKMIAGTMAILGIALLLMGAALLIISKLSWDQLAVGITGIGALMVFIEAFVIGLTRIDPSGAKLLLVSGMAILLSIALIAMSAAIRIIGVMSWDELARGIVGIGALMVFIKAFITGLKSVKNDVLTIFGVLMSLSIALIMMSAAMLIIASISWENAIKGLVVLGVLMLMMAVFLNNLKIIAKSDPVSMLFMFAGVVVVLISLAGAILMLSKVPFEQAIGSVAAMSILLIAVSAMLFMLSKTGTVSVRSIISIVIIIAVVLVFADLLHIISAIDSTAAATNVAVMAIFIIAMAALMVVVSAVSAVAITAVAGLAGIAVFVAALVGLLELLGQIADVEAINKAGDALYAVGRALGRGIGGIIGGIGEGIAGSLPAIAESIATFIDTISKTSSDLPDVGTLISLIKDVTGLSFGKKMDASQFSTDLTSVAEGICKVASIFNENKELLSDTSSIENALAISETLKNITDAIPKEGGLLSKVLGSKDMDGFGESVSSYAKSIGTFAQEINKYKEDLSDSSIFDTVVDVSKKMIELNESLPKTGGIVQDILGEADMATFGLKLVAYGASLGLFATTLDLYKDVLDDVTIFEMARDIGLIMNEVNEALPKTGGIVQDILGESDMAAFGTKLEAYGQSVGIFGTKLNEYHDILADQEMFQNAANIGTKMAGMQEAIPKSDGWVQKILGKSDMETFGQSLEGFGTAIGTFGTSLVDIDFAMIEKAMPHITGIVNTLNLIDPKNPVYKDKGYFKALSQNLEDLAAGLNTFHNELVDMEYVEMINTIRALSGLFNLVNEFGIGTGMQNFKTFSDSFVALAETGIDDFVAAFDGTDKKVSKAAKTFIETFSKALEDNASSVEDGAKSILDTAVKILKDTSGFIEAGKDAASGFATGLRRRDYDVSAAAAALGLVAKGSLAKSLQIKSPSRETMKLGSFFGEGFVKGMNSYADNIYSSASDLGTSAINSLNNAIAGAKDLIENNVDSQPTIRPVLDLSDIQSGAGRIGALLNSSPMIFGGSGMAQSISRSFIGQNGRNYDVVSALDRLGSDIVNNTSGDSYVINGVSYEEGSDVAEAIQILAHAATVNGRR